MPPSTPVPSHTIHNWCVFTPTAPSAMPPHQQTAATTPALRGPTRSSQPPQIAAAMPRNAMNSVNVKLTDGTDQLHVVVNRSVVQLASFGQDPSGVASSFVIGNQNTEKPYAMPMHR